MADASKPEKPPKFSFKILAKSIGRTMFEKARKASEITQLDSQRMKDLMDKIGEWVIAYKFLGGNRKIARKAIKAGRWIKDKVGLA